MHHTFTYNKHDNYFTVVIDNVELKVDPDNLADVLITTKTKNKRPKWKLDVNGHLYSMTTNTKKIYLLGIIYNVPFDKYNWLFINKNIYDIRKVNIKCEQIGVTDLPKSFKIIEEFNGHVVRKGKSAGSVYNPFWLVDNKQVQNEPFYVVHCKPNILCYFSKESIDVVNLNSNVANVSTWFVVGNHIVSSINGKNVPMQKLLKKSKKKIYHVNGNTFDNRLSNLKCVESLNNMLPKEFTVVKSYDGHIVTRGKQSGSVFNPYWKVINKNVQNEPFFVMSCKPNALCYFSKESVGKLVHDNKKIPTWFLGKNGYVAANFNRKNIYMHQIITGHMGHGKGQKSIDHINQNKLDNRLSNLRIVDQSTQNRNTAKRRRKHNACPLPDGMVQSDMPKYVVYNRRKVKGGYNQYFTIERHPFQTDGKKWFGKTSDEYNAREKLDIAIERLKVMDRLLNTANIENIGYYTVVNKKIVITDLSYYDNITGTKEKPTMVVYPIVNNAKLGKWKCDKLTYPTKVVYRLLAPSTTKIDNVKKIFATVETGTIGVYDCESFKKCKPIPKPNNINYKISKEGCTFKCKSQNLPIDITLKESRGKVCAIYLHTG